MNIFMLDNRSITTIIIYCEYVTERLQNEHKNKIIEYL